MSDDVPPPQSEASVSDQSQAHPSDRQTTTTDTQQQPPEKAPGELSQSLSSDRQASDNPPPIDSGAGWHKQDGAIVFDPDQIIGTPPNSPSSDSSDQQASDNQTPMKREEEIHGGVRFEGRAEPERDHSTGNSKPDSPKDPDGQAKGQKAGKGDDPLPAGTSPHGADKDQPHPSDRQTTAADTRQKPLEKSSEKATDKQSLVKRINQWEELSKSEKSRMDKVIAEEKKPNGKLLNQDDPSLAHLIAVVDAVNLALSRSNPPSLEGKQSVQDRLEAARQYISVWRGESKTHSESLILRDAERYLWARSGVGEFAKEKFSGSTSAARTLAETGYAVYDVAKIVAIVSGSDYVKANKDLPFSARGGYDWWSLGLQHWDRFDKDSLNTFGDLKHLTYEDMIRYQDALARKQEADDFNPGRSKWY